MKAENLASEVSNLGQVFLKSSCPSDVIHYGITGPGNGLHGGGSNAGAGFICGRQKSDEGPSVSQSHIEIPSGLGRAWLRVRFGGQIA